MTFFRIESLYCVRLLVNNDFLSVEATAATKADDIVARMMWNQTKEEMYVLYINTDFHKTVLT